MIQRDTPAPATSRIPYRKVSPDLEATYRRAGLTAAADAIKRCRETGDCSKVLTDAEAWNAFANGKVSAGMGDPDLKSAPPAAYAGVAAVAPAAAARGAALTATERAALQWGTARVIQGGAGATAEAVATGGAEALATGGAEALATGGAEVVATGAATGAGVAAATVLIPVALAVYVAVSIWTLVNYATFEAELRKQGYVILPDPLAVCIGMCHTGPAPSYRPTIPRTIPDLPGPGPLTEKDRRSIEDWIKGSGKKTSADPVTPPVPAPDPAKKKDEEEKARCRLVRRDVSRGGDPLSDLFCSVVSQNSPSYDIYSVVGRAEIDALQGRNWFECKCGQLPLVRAAKRGEAWAKARLEGPTGLDEQILRQSRIAFFCRYSYRLAVANKEVEDFMRERYPFVDVVRVPFEPCE
jgi:hypothetical protein